MENIVDSSLTSYIQRVRKRAFKYKQCNDKVRQNQLTNKILTNTPLELLDYKDWLKEYKLLSPAEASLYKRKCRDTNLITAGFCVLTSALALLSHTVDVNIFKVSQISSICIHLVVLCTANAVAIPTISKQRMPLLIELFSKHKDQTIEIINDKQSPLNLMKQSLNKEKNKK